MSGFSTSTPADVLGVAGKVFNPLARRDYICNGDDGGREQGDQKVLSFPSIKHSKHNIRVDESE